MCRIYTGAFINRKWLDEEGRKPYQEAAINLFSQLDIERAQNEIALIDRKTGEITYGLQSLITIVTHRHPWTKKILSSGIIRWTLQHLYAFISYNRKVIAAVKPTGRSCNPSFNLPYRIAYLVVAWLLSAFLFTRFTQLIQGLNCNAYLICLGHVLFQTIHIISYPREKVYDYLGNIMTVFLMGSRALLPALVLSQWHSNPFFFTVYLTVVFLGMLVEHMRRIKLLGLSLLLAASWVAFFIVIILIIK